MNLIKVVHLKIINKLIVLKELQRSHSTMDNCSFSMECISMQNVITLWC